MIVDGMKVDGIKVDDRPSPAPAVDSIDLGAETLVYDGRDLHLLTAQAAEIWRLADGRVTAAQISTLLAEEASVGPEQVHRDVMSFLDQLTELCLLVITDPVPPTGFRRPPYVGYVLDGDQALLVDLRDGRRRGLNPTGTAVWRLICQHGDPVTVLRLLRAEFPDAPATLETEVTTLLEQLSTAGLLVATADRRASGE